jgi:hypothetical protein
MRAQRQLSTTEVNEGCPDACHTGSTCCTMRQRQYMLQSFE